MSSEEKMRPGGDEFNDLGKPVEPTGSFRRMERSLLNEAPNETDTRHSDQLPLEIETGVDGNEADMKGDGYAVYEPPHIESLTSEKVEREEILEDDGMEGEWEDIRKKVSILYGDSLAGMAGYMGPVGMLLMVVSGAIIAITASFENASNVISKPFLLGSAGAFIIGIFLLLFHAIHWLSNRNKRVTLAREIKAMLLVETCIYVDVSQKDEVSDMALKCNYFNRELGKAPECLACPHYVLNVPDEGARETVVPVAEDDTVEIFREQGEEFKVKPVGQTWDKTVTAAGRPTAERQLLDEFNGPKIGGESGGDLDEAPEEEQPENEDTQLGITWEELEDGKIE